MPVTGWRGFAGDDGEPVRDAATGMAGRDGVKFGRDCEPPMWRGALVVDTDDAVRAGGGAAGVATRAGGGAAWTGRRSCDGVRGGCIDGSVFGAASNSPESDAPGSVWSSRSCTTGVPKK